MSAHDFAAYLTEPAPCDECASAEVCRFTGAACKAFSAYITGQPWQDIARNPTLGRGKQLGLQAAEMTDADRARLLAGMMK